MRLGRIAALLCLSGCSLLTELDGLSTGEGASDAAATPETSRPAADAETTRDAGESDAIVDSSTGPDAMAVELGPFALVQQSGNIKTGLSITTPLASPTRAGNLIVVAIAQNGSLTASTASIQDNAASGSSTYLSANQRALLPCADPATGNTVEIWYAANIHVGATSVTLTMTETVNVDVWVMEFAGASRVSPLDKGARLDDQPSSTVFTTPPVMPPSPRALVVSALTTCNTVTGIRSPNPFAPLPLRDGNGTAYFVAAASGSYGAVWNAELGTFAASTVAFH